MAVRRPSGCESRGEFQSSPCGCEFQSSSRSPRPAAWPCVETRFGRSTKQLTRRRCAGYIWIMSNARFDPPQPYNEPVLDYAPGSTERAAVKAKLAELKSAPIEVPLVIGGREVKTGNTAPLRAPHDHTLDLGVYHKAGEAEVRMAIDAALEARAAWSEMPWEQRASVIMKAADLLAGPLAPDGQRGDHAGPVQDGIPGGDRLGLRTDRLLAVQRFLPGAAHERPAGLLARRVEPPGVQGPRGVRIRRHALQFHGHRRQPAHGARPDRLYGPLETGLIGGLFGLARHGAAAGSRPAARRDQLHPGVRGRGGRSGARQPRPGGDSLHGIDGHVSADVPLRGREPGAHEALSPDRGRDGRQGFHLRPRLGGRGSPGRGGGPRRLRIPGAEVFRGLPDVRAPLPVAGLQGTVHGGGSAG